MASVPPPPLPSPPSSPGSGGRQAGRASASDHESFLRHARFRWLKIASVLCLAAIIGYIAADVRPRPNGGSWYGYALGTIGAGLIVWLALLGIRKRAMTRGGWSLKAWTSAHVYLGLALIVVATLHSGFQFGWNVHTLAYALMVLVIASGVFGVVAYATLPRALSSNRQEMTTAQMGEALRAIDRQLHDAAQPLDRAAADRVRAVLAEDPFAGGIIARLSGAYPHCATQAALAGFLDEDGAGVDGEAGQRVQALLRRRLSHVERMRRQMRIRGLLEVWLYVHVPVTFALLGALAAHIISVFFYW